jgi:hypothetical protein
MPFCIHLRMQFCEKGFTRIKMRKLVFESQQPYRQRRCTDIVNYGRVVRSSLHSPFHPGPVPFPHGASCNALCPMTLARAESIENGWFGPHALFQFSSSKRSCAILNTYLVKTYRLLAFLQASSRYLKSNSSLATAASTSPSSPLSSHRTSCTDICALALRGPTQSGPVCHLGSATRSHHSEQPATSTCRLPRRAVALQSLPGSSARSYCLK